MIRCSSCAAENPDTGRFCSNCAAPLSSASGAEAETVAEAVRPPSASSAAPPSSSTSSTDEGRFPAGTLLLDRYRIVALLGRGGMGEVYRATDLRLGQPVALKFLPQAVAQNAAALSRFHNEVRIARQVSHPNVCRVYDIGEIDGVPFLSMEYVDGEDLGSLLRRIGRLPADKALEIARKLCAGLAAAHDKGVLHRDLKPGNVMLDGRGNVLITDFGLAALSGQVLEHEIRHGTPAYMAPEQLAGREVTAKSDLFALGMVLYEIFAGKRAFEAATQAELMKQQEESTPVSLTTIVRDIDPAIERVIQRCLAPDPRNRPASALAVAAALPGGDPLAAALAAGETPSPDMVAASGETEGLRPNVAMALLGGIAVALIAIVLLSAKTNLLEKIPFDLSAETLTVKAREMIQRLGYTGRGVGVAYGFGYASDYVDYVLKHDSSPARWAHVGSGQPPLVYFWYRQSPRYFDPRYELRVSEGFPHMDLSGEALVYLDAQGRLLGFSAVPPQVDQSKGPPPATDWIALFKAAELDPAKFQPVDPQWLPLAGFDARAAWTGPYPGAPKIPLRIEASSWRGKPVSFDLVAPWTRPTRVREAETSAGQRVANIVVITVLCIVLVGATLMARRNTRLRRSDSRGAMRLAAFLFAVSILQYLCSMYYVPNDNEVGLVVAAISEALFKAALVWVMYLALEPFVRRRWPQTIVSWSRVLAGKLRDPLVGGDILIGVAFGLGWILLFQGASLIWQRLGVLPDPSGLMVLAGVRYLVGNVFANLAAAVAFTFSSFFFVFLLKLVARRDWLAGAIFVAVFVLVRSLSSSMNLAVLIPLMIVVYTIFVVLLLKYGIVPLIVGIFTADLLGNAPVTSNFSAWYFTSSLLTLLVVTAVALYGFRCAVAGKKLFEID